MLAAYCCLAPRLRINVRVCVLVRLRVLVRVPVTSLPLSASMAWAGTFYMRILKGLSRFIFSYNFSKISCIYIRIDIVLSILVQLRMVYSITLRIAQTTCSVEC